MKRCLAEIFPAIDGVDHVLKHLRSWMKPRRRAVDLRNYFGARNRVIPQPLGVIGVIVPWNFPINLTMIQLTYIFAAGNRAMVKMSENSRHLAAVLMERMPAYFPPEKLQIFDETGGVGMEFSKLPFDHLLFTGSGQTGRAVMAAAARNLCPVTLELGGKAPAMMCDDFPLRRAAERILFVKYLNAGQICTTVDYAWMPEHRLGEFVELAKKIVPKRYAGWVPRTTPRSSTSAPSIASLAPSKKRASAAPLWSSWYPVRPTTGLAEDRAAHRVERAGRLRTDAARDFRPYPAAAHLLAP